MAFINGYAAYLDSYAGCHNNMQLIIAISDGSWID